MNFAGRTIARNPDWTGRDGALVVGSLICAAADTVLFVRLFIAPSTPLPAYLFALVPGVYVAGFIRSGLRRAARAPAGHAETPGGPYRIPASPPRPPPPAEGVSLLAMRSGLATFLLAHLLLAVLAGLGAAFLSFLGGTSCGGH